MNKGNLQQLTPYLAIGVKDFERLQELAHKTGPYTPAYCARTAKHLLWLNRKGERQHG